MQDDKIYAIIFENSRFCETVDDILRNIIRVRRKFENSIDRRPQH